jgi:hypothetical protein
MSRRLSEPHIDANYVNQAIQTQQSGNVIFANEAVPDIFYVVSTSFTEKNTRVPIFLRSLHLPGSPLQSFAP